MAHNVTVSVDGGNLVLNGTIGASGAAPGTIRLSAINGLTLNSTAVLDAHGTVLQVDSYGQPIEAKNSGSIELTATHGMLTLSPGATVDLSTPDGVAYGDIELNASRTGETSGDINVAASGPLNIRGRAEHRGQWFLGLFADRPIRHHCSGQRHHIDARRRRGDQQRAGLRRAGADR